MIYALREMNMPLEEIKSYMCNRSPERLLQLFQEERKVIDEQMKRLRKTKQWILDKSAHIQEALTIETNKITVETEPERYLIQSKEDFTDGRRGAQAIGDLMDYCNKHEVKSPYSIGYRQNKTDIEDGIYNNYHVFYEMVDHKPQKINYQIKPQGRYLVAYHKGRWQNLGVTYEKILKYADKNGIELGEYFYEDSLFDVLTMADEEEYIIKITCQMNGRKERNGISI